MQERQRCSSLIQCGGPAYGPSSLDFLNPPNPIEPHAVAHREASHATQRLDKSSSHDLLRMLLEDGSASSTRPTKRRKSSENELLSLPKLPVRSGWTKRIRIPPTLSGLHEPPPGAGLLPSIHVKDLIPRPILPTVPRPEVPPTTETNPEAHLRAGDDNLHTSATCPAPSKQHRNKWTIAETDDLMAGVKRFGVGNWTKILQCTDYCFDGRSGIALKDRFRIIGPSEYRRWKNGPDARDPKPGRGEDTKSNPPSTRAGDAETRTEQPEQTDDTPLPASTRRKRHAWTAHEDEALLRGIRKHGKQWQSMHADEILSLASRTPTDLRDRLRSKFPQECVSIGLKLPRSAPNPDTRVLAVRGDGADLANSTGTSAAKDIAQPTKPPLNQEQAVVPRPSNPDNVLLFQYEDLDVFFGSPWQDGEEDARQTVLDRSILDSFQQSARAVPAGLSLRGLPEPQPLSIDPKKTMKLPLSSAPAGGNLESTALLALNAINLPSHLEGGIQLELPSFMQQFGNVDTDARMLSLEELLG